MVKKRLGYVELEWSCPNCSTRNPGPHKYCDACGAPQPPEVAFEQPPDAELLQRNEVEETLKAGPDVHCPYCGTRNRGDAGFCGSCGGDLQEGVIRQAGQIVGVKPSPGSDHLFCAACGAQNGLREKACIQCGAPLAIQTEATSVEEAPVLAEQQKASRRRVPVGLILGGGILAALVCGALLLFFGKRDETAGVVQSLSWTRSIEIEAYMEVEKEGWLDEIPNEGRIQSCESTYRYSSDQPEPSSVEVCGTPYTQDTGTGIGEVVQDCVYEVYEDYCSYTSFDWAVFETLTESGVGSDPFWPALSLLDDQREGTQEEAYTVTFLSNGKSYDYSTQSLQEYQQFSPGSEWILILNLFGAVVDVQSP